MRVLEDVLSFVRVAEFPASWKVLQSSRHYVRVYHLTSQGAVGGAGTIFSPN